VSLSDIAGQLLVDEVRWVWTVREFGHHVEIDALGGDKLVGLRRRVGGDRSWRGRRRHRQVIENVVLAGRPHA